MQSGANSRAWWKMSGFCCSAISAKSQAMRTLPGGFNDAVDGMLAINAFWEFNFLVLLFFNTVFIMNINLIRTCAFGLLNLRHKKKRLQSTLLEVWSTLVAATGDVSQAIFGNMWTLPNNYAQSKFFIICLNFQKATTINFLMKFSK